MRNGSYATAAQTGIAGTAIRDAVPGQAILTPADVLRSYSQYNETGYAAFAMAQATRDGVPRAMLERDAKAVRVQLIAPSLHSVEENHTPLMMDGSALYAPAEGGFGGSLLLGTGRHASTRYEVLADGTAPLANFDGVSVHASQINAFSIACSGVMSHSWNRSKSFKSLAISAASARPEASSSEVCLAIANAAATVSRIASGPVADVLAEPLR